MPNRVFPHHFPFLIARAPESFLALAHVALLTPTFSTFAILPFSITLSINYRHSLTYLSNDASLAPSSLHRTPIQTHAYKFSIFKSTKMRVTALLIAGLSALASAHPNIVAATDQAASMIAAASRTNAAAASHAAAIISSERAAQTLSGAAASQAAHNSLVLASALAAQTAERSTIANAEKSVLSEASVAKHSISMALATATGMFRALHSGLC